MEDNSLSKVERVNLRTKLWGIVLMVVSVVVFGCYFLNLNLSGLLWGSPLLPILLFCSGYFFFKEYRALNVKMSAQFGIPSLVALIVIGLPALSAASGPRESFLFVLMIVPIILLVAFVGALVIGYFGLIEANKGYGRKLMYVLGVAIVLQIVLSIIS